MNIKIKPLNQYASQKKIPCFRSERTSLDTENLPNNQHYIPLDKRNRTILNILYQMWSVNMKRATSSWISCNSSKVWYTKSNTTYKQRWKRQVSVTISRSSCFQSGERKVWTQNPKHQHHLPFRRKNIDCSRLYKGSDLGTNGFTFKLKYQNLVIENTHI